jgi:hypothetical protein
MHDLHNSSEVTFQLTQFVSSKLGDFLNDDDDDDDDDITNVKIVVGIHNNNSVWFFFNARLT